MLKESHSNSRRIVKNTVILYGRMVVLMFISLFTSRVVLDTLGIVDYGIQNAVGSLVATFTFISSTISGAMSRFLTFELGRRDAERLKAVFSTSLTIQLAQALVIGLILEIGGLWYLNTRLVLPPERLAAANIIYQLSILGCMQSLMFSAYGACIVAHERMSFYAYTSLFDAVMKLVVVYSLYISPYDKLVTNATLGFVIQIIGTIITVVYCRRQFEECRRYRLCINRELLREMGTYAAWNLLPPLSMMLRTNGMNLLLNAFFGPLVNAAQGVANTVGGATRQLATSFMASTRPQITKCYANGELEESISLTFMSARMTAALLLLFVLPICLEADTILNLWLVDVPDYAVVFVQLALINIVVENFSSPLVSLVHATGRIKYYELFTCCIMLTILPAAYLLLRLGFSPSSAIWINSIVVGFCTICGIYLTHSVVPKFIPGDFLRNVLGRSVLFIALASIAPCCVVYLMPPSLVRLFLVGVTSTVSILLAMLGVGLDVNERAVFMQKIRQAMPFSG